MIDPHAMLTADPGSVAAAYVHLALPGLLTAFAALGSLMALLVLPRNGTPTVLSMPAGER
jgi:hypothetical protein